MVERLFLAMPGGCLRFVIVVFPDHTHLLFSEGPVFLDHFKQMSTGTSVCEFKILKAEWYA